MRKIERRTFLKGVLGTAGAAAAIGVCPRMTSGGVLGANERFRIAVCGLNGRGGNHVDNFVGMENVEISGLVDPDQRVLDRMVSRVRDRSKNAYVVKGFADDFGYDLDEEGQPLAGTGVGETSRMDEGLAEAAGEEDAAAANQAEEEEEIATAS